MWISDTGCRAPHKAVSVQTISRWLKQCLELAGIDTAVYKGHSFRHASTSKAKSVGVSIDDIFLTGGWKLILIYSSDSIIGLLLSRFRILLYPK